MEPSFTITMTNDEKGYLYKLHLYKDKGKLQEIATANWRDVTKTVGIAGEELYDILVEMVANKFCPPPLHKEIKRIVEENYMGRGFTLINYVYRKDDRYLVEDIFEGSVVLNFELPLNLNLEEMSDEEYKIILGYTRKTKDWIKSRDDILLKIADRLPVVRVKTSLGTTWIKFVETMYKGHLYVTRFALLSDGTCECEDMHLGQVFYTKLYVDEVCANPSTEYLKLLIHCARKKDPTWLTSFEATLNKPHHT